MYQNKANGVVGGVLGRNDLLKSQHMYADFSAYGCWFFIILFPKYHKLKNCRKVTPYLYLYIRSHFLVLYLYKVTPYMDLYIGSHFIVIYLCKVWPYIQIVRSDLNLTFGEWKESIAEIQQKKSSVASIYSK